MADEPIKKESRQEDSPPAPEGAKRDASADASGPAIRRGLIGVNVVSQILLAAAILVAVNFLSFRFYERRDFSSDASFSLAEQTKRAIEDARGTLRFILFYSAASPSYPRLEALLKEYQYHASSGKRRTKIIVETVDPYRNLARAQELQNKHKFGASENIVIVEYEGRTKILTDSDIAQFDNSGVALGEPPRMVAFSGEAALTGAIIELLQDKQGKVYFLGGFGGHVPGADSQIQTLVQFIERQFFSVGSLDLASLDVIPPDADVLILAGPKYDLSEREAGLLSRYWNENAGRLIVLLDPNAKTPRLKSFLASLGVTPRDDRILRTIDMQTVVGILRDVTGRFADNSPATVGLSGVDSLLIGGTQSLEVRKPLEGENLDIRTVLTSADGFWGETKYGLSQGEPVIFEPDQDHPGPLAIAATVERGGVGDKRVKVNSSRLLVVGNSAFATDAALTPANLDFLLNTINWMSDREDLIGIAPKPVKEFRLNLSEDEVGRLTMIVMGALPGLAAVVGIFVWWRRRY